MKTIEERAKREGIISQHRADYPYDKKSVEFGYIQGAYDQKEADIDKACSILEDMAEGRLGKRFISEFKNKLKYGVLERY